MNNITFEVSTKLSYDKLNTGVHQVSVLKGIGYALFDSGYCN